MIDIIKLVFSVLIVWFFALAVFNVQLSLRIVPITVGQGDDIPMLLEDAWNKSTSYDGNSKKRQLDIRMGVPNEE